MSEKLSFVSPSPIINVTSPLVFEVGKCSSEYTSIPLLEFLKILILRPTS